MAARFDPDELYIAVFSKGGSLSDCKRLVRKHSNAIITQLRASRSWEAGNSAMHDAVRYDRIKILAYFLKTGLTDLNIRSQSNQTPLTLALRERRFKCYEMLVAAGADPFPEDLDLETSLHCAAALGDVERFEELLSTEPSDSRQDYVHT
eukprot:m.679063 g.679063  ORF g.679063 m.679063 type:complete len:150 (-) comp58582_c0_seq15:97-546(-)